MTNEEKAKEIAMPCPACFCLWTKDMMYKQEHCKDCVPQDRFTGAMQMAQWKDEQLESKLMQIIILAQQGYTSGATDEIILKHCKEIINENHEHNTTKTD